LGVALGAMLLFGLLAPGPAFGARVEMVGTTLTYTPDFEEVDNLSVDQRTDGFFTLTSTGSTPLNDGDGVGVGCEVVVAGDVATATCPPPVGSIVIDVGSRDDTVTLAASVTVPATLTGGNGVDTLTGGSGNDTLHLRKNGAGDRANCGAGDDTVDLDREDVASPDCEALDYPPQTTITGGPPVVTGNATGLVFTFRSDPDASLLCNLAGPVGFSGVPCADRLELPRPPATTLPDGSYVFQIISNDGISEGPTARQTFTVDTIAPQVIVTRLSPTDGSTAHFQLDAVDTTAVTFECWIGTAAPAPCSDIFSTPALPDGDYVLFVRATDAAAHGSTADVPFTIRTPAAAAQQPAAQPRRIIIDSLVLISGRTVKMSRRGVVAISLTCAGTRKCSGRMKITTAEPVSRKSRKLVTLGSKRFSIAANKRKKVRVRFSKSKRRLARRLKRFKAKVVINEIDQRGNPRISSRVFVLRAR
jgi:hypothetical protein